MYRNIKNYELRYTDVDAYDNLKLSALLSFMEESACRSADELGFGYDDITPHNIGFIIANWYINFTLVYDKYSNFCNVAGYSLF